MTLSATLESALIGQASKQDVIEAIDAELSGKVTVLVSNAYKAAAQAMKQADKPESKRDAFPIMSTLLIRVHDGHLLFTPFCWGDAIERAKRTEAIPARVEAEFSTCVPAKQFTNWLKASQLTTEEKRKGISEQINFIYYPRTCTLTIEAGNSRAMFKCIDSAEFPAV